MSNEIITHDTDIAAVGTPDVPVEHFESSVKETGKTTKADKRLEKLLSLKEKYEKAATVQAAATKKANDINAQISKIEKEIYAEEVAEIDRLCAEKNLSYKDIALILKSIPEGMTVCDVKNLFE